MAQKAKTEEPERRVWKDILIHVSKRKEGTFTAADLCDEMDLQYTSAGQVLGRLRRWGHVRVVGFENPAGNGPGRRRQSFEITEKGRSKVEYLTG